MKIIMPIIRMFIISLGAAMAASYFSLWQSITILIIVVGWAMWLDAKMEFLAGKHKNEKDT